MNSGISLNDLTLQLRAFAADRQWGQFHSPKNLAMALTVEAAELQEIFQWLTETQSNTLPSGDVERAKAEMADVLLYLLQLADRLDIDLLEAAQAKIYRNAEKYPVSQSRGTAEKISDFQKLVPPSK